MGTKLKNSNCDKTQITTKLNKLSCEKTQKNQMELWRKKTPKLNFLENFKTEIGTKLKNLNCEKT